MRAHEKIQRRAAWLNENVLGDIPIDDEALECLRGLEVENAMAILRDVEEKKDDIRNPSAYVLAATRKPRAAGGDGGKQKGKGKGSLDLSKIERRAEWLNDKVFLSMPIDAEAIAAMQGVGVQRAMELFKELEEKAEQITNPGGYLKSAARREGFGPPLESKAKGKGFVDKIQKRAEWLNDMVFPDRPIDVDAIAAMQGVGVRRAMELFKEIEEKAGQIKNPGGYLKSAARREGFGPPVDVNAAFDDGHNMRGNLPGFGEGANKVARRADWLSAHVFQDRPIDEDAVAAMMGVGVPRAMELFKDLEERAVQIKNPSGYLKNAARCEGFAPPKLPALHTTKKRAAPASRSGTPDGRPPTKTPKVTLDAPLEGSAAAEE